MEYDNVDVATTIYKIVFVYKRKYFSGTWRDSGLETIDDEIWHLMPLSKDAYCFTVSVFVMPLSFRIGILGAHIFRHDVDSNITHM